jgi:hypothetical protein
MAGTLAQRLKILDTVHTLRGEEYDIAVKQFAKLLEGKQAAPFDAFNFGKTKKEHYAARTAFINAVAAYQKTGAKGSKGSKGKRSSKDKKERDRSPPPKLPSAPKLQVRAEGPVRVGAEPPEELEGRFVEAGNSLALDKSTLKMIKEYLEGRKLLAEGKWKKKKPPMSADEFYVALAIDLFDALYGESEEQEVELLRSLNYHDLMLTPEGKSGAEQAKLLAQIPRDAVEKVLLNLNVEVQRHNLEESRFDAIREAAKTAATAEGKYAELDLVRRRTIALLNELEAAKGNPGVKPPSEAALKRARKAVEDATDAVEAYAERRGEDKVAERAQQLQNARNARWEMIFQGEEAYRKAEAVRKAKDEELEALLDPKEKLKKLKVQYPGRRSVSLQRMMEKENAQIRSIQLKQLKQRFKGRHSASLQKMLDNPKLLDKAAAELAFKEMLLKTIRTNRKKASSKEIRETADKYMELRRKVSEALTPNEEKKAQAEIEKLNREIYGKTGAPTSDEDDEDEEADEEYNPEGDDDDDEDEDDDGDDEGDGAKSGGRAYFTRRGWQPLPRMPEPARYGGSRFIPQLLVPRLY